MEILKTAKKRPCKIYDWSGWNQIPGLLLFPQETSAKVKRVRITTTV